jgi:hypothetical protein
MYRAAAAPQHASKIHRQLLSRHYHQILSRSDGEHDALTNLIAIIFRPGNRTNCFSEPLRKLGQGTLVCLTYEWDEQTGRRRMPIIGLRAQLGRDGFVTYGGEGSLLFHHDAARRPSIRSRCESLNPLRNPDLVQLALRMDRTCRRALGRTRWLPSVPNLPQVLVGFAASEVPDFEDSVALRKLAAFEMGMPIEELGRNGEVLLRTYLKDLWLRQVWRADDPINSTRSVLLNAEYCTRIGRALTVYEDYRSLLGAPTWNPARRAAPLKLANPATGILKEFGIESLEQPITNEQLDAMVSAFRLAVGPDISLTETEIYDAFANSHQPLRAWSPKLAELRSLLEPGISETVNDDDLLRAAAAPDNPLIASQGCMIQIIRRYPASEPGALRFGPDVLGRRIELDLTSRYPVR